MKRNKPKIRIWGQKDQGYVITVIGSDGFKDDIALTREELLLLKEKLKKLS